MHLLRAFLLVILSALAAHAQTLDPIRYTLSFPSLMSHYVDVEAVYPTDGQAQIILMMPVWTPGSYLVREFERNVEGLAASDANHAALPVEKVRKNRWRVQTNGGRSVSVHYKVYAHEMSVRTNWIDDEFGLLNGAATFITLTTGLNRPHEVKLVMPTAWSRSVSAMPAGLSPDTYRAPNYDTLVDSPIVVGNPAIYEFTAGGKPHYLVNVAERDDWDGKRSADDLATIVRKTVEFWGSAPYDRYYFLNVIGGNGGGLEHNSSTVINPQRDSTKTREGYLRWLSTASHEFFHAWNVKRLRPIELGPFDYENEVYTRSLWFVEGVTDYYADLQSHRSGVANEEEYLSALSAEIAVLQSTPGRLTQSAELASYDAWIKYYRPDDNSANASISYYTKGLVIGFLLDAKIRRMTGGTKTLDDLMRLMYQRFSGAKGYTSENLRAAVVEIVGASNGAELRRWLTGALETTNELGYSEALDWYGLQFTPDPEPPRAWLGIVTRSENQRTVVSEVRRGSPAEEAGIMRGDQIISINDVPLSQVALGRALEALAPNARAQITLARRGIAFSADVTLARDPSQFWWLVPRADASPAQLAHRTAWLK